MPKVLYLLWNSAPVILTINGTFWNGHARQLNLISVLFLSYFLTSCDKTVYVEGKCALLGGGVKQKIVINPGFLSRQTFWYFYWQNISSCFMRENEVTVLIEVNRRESGSNFTFVCEKGCTSTAPSKWRSIFKGTISLEIRDTPPQNWPFCN